MCRRNIWRYNDMRERGLDANLSTLTRRVLGASGQSIAVESSSSIVTKLRRFAFARLPKGPVGRHEALDHGRYDLGGVRSGLPGFAPFASA
jgi:hypothetical protein